MGRMSVSTRSRVVSMSEKGFKLCKIQKHLANEGITVSKKSLCLLIKRLRTTGSVADRRSTRPRKKLKDEKYRFIDECMAEDDELTAAKMLSLLLQIEVSNAERQREYGETSTNGTRVDNKVQRTYIGIKPRKASRMV